MAEGATVGQIVLVGMPGSGKSTVGRRVATALDVPFVDTDAALVVTSGREIDAWFSDVGEKGFRKAESRLVRDLLAAPTTQVLATGGGVVVMPATRAALRDDCHTVVWLRAGPAFLASRIARKSDQNNRPLLGKDPRAALERLEAERRELYAEVADIIVDVEPVMAGADHPRRELAALIVDTLARARVQVWR